MSLLPKHALLLDIETTGLSRQKDAIISIGMVEKDLSGTLVHSHLFLNGLEEEAHLLKQFLEHLTSIQVIYTYGGRTFDEPFICERLKYYNLDVDSFLRIKRVDLKDSLRCFSKRRFALEQFFRFKRQTELTGADIVKLYRTFLETKDETFSKLIMLHQKDELNSLCAFVELYRILLQLENLQEASFTSTPSTVTCHFKSSVLFQHDFHAVLNQWQITYSKNTIDVVMPIVETSLKCSVTPIKDYYYVPAQNQLLHKSLAQFIPSQSRRRPTKEECCLWKNSSFLPLLSHYKVDVPLWYDMQQNSYIEASMLDAELIITQLYNSLHTFTKQ